MGLKRGYIQVYTGNGKGKSTAAFGLALRAAGAGHKVYIAQFVKGMEYSELSSFPLLSEWITLKQYGRDCFINGTPSPDDIRAAVDALNAVRDIVVSGGYDVVILDEINIATHFNLVTVPDVLALMDAKPDATELIMTGRYADPAVIDKADLVTEMREIKHYYRQGVVARPGIES